MYKSLLLLLCTVCYLSCVLAGCPHADSTLKKWSLASSWPSGVVPTALSNVVIPANTRIILDVSPPELKSITVDGGVFVWGDYNNLEIVTEAFLVKNKGEIWIGSEDCLFAKKAIITLTGNPTSGSYGSFGNKVLGAGANGTLELHGANFGPSWTKITSTISVPGYKTTAFGRGMNVIAINPNTGSLISFKTFDTFSSTNNSDLLANFINSQPTGTAISVIAADEASNKLNSNAISALKSIGSFLISQIKYRSGWVCHGVKGAANGTAVEEMRDETARPTNIVSRIFSNFGVRGQAYQPYGGFVEIFSAGTPTINLAEDVAWTVGQQIVVASTDQEYTHAEQNEIIQIINSKQIKVKYPFNFTHWGKIENGVDERAEIGLLTRSILIRGRQANSNDTYGGQTRYLANFTNVHIENVEFFQMGQDGVVGSYPVHFHMAFDVDSVGKYTKPAYVKGCGIWKSYNRCVTIHGTRGALVQGNVAYDHMGHCYFLEDGSEERNVLDKNLGILTKFGNTILSDWNPSRCTGELSGFCKGPATFWITNPNNTLTNNVAAGGVAFGIWYIFPSRPMGLSAPYYPNLQIQFVPLKTFKNNFIHSTKIGLMVDDGIVSTPGPTYLGINGARYRPHELPNTSSPRVIANFDDVTIHHCKERGIWLRGGDFRVNRAKLADNVISVTLASEGTMPNDAGSSQEILDSLIVGITANNYSQLSTSRIRGFEIYDGPVRVVGCSFLNFPDTGSNSSAIAAKENNVWQIATTNEVVRSTFSNVAKTVYYQIPRGDGDRTNVFLDTDGAVSGKAKSSVVFSHPIHLTKKCTTLLNNQAATCPDKYGQLYIANKVVATTNFSSGAKAILYRDEKQSAPLDLTGFATPPSQYQPLVLLNKTYTLNFAHTSPSYISIQMTNFDKYDHLRIGVCYPKNSNFTVRFKKGNVYSPLSSVSSISAVDSNTVSSSYFWDNSVGMLFVKLVSQNNRNGLEYCAAGGCESVEIQVSGPGIGKEVGICGGVYPKYAKTEL